MYKYIEQKFRTKNKSNRFYILKFISLILLLTIIFISIIKIKNMSTNEHLENIISKQLTIKENVKLINSTKDYSEFKGNLTKILTIGDSMGNDINALLTFTKQYNNKFELRHYFISHKCQFMQFDRNKLEYYKNDKKLVEMCEKSTNGVLDSQRLRDANLIIISFNWYDFIPKEGFENIIKILKEKTNAKIIILGKRPYFTRGASQYISNSLLEYKNLNNFEKYIYSNKRMDSINMLIKKYSENLGIEFIDVTDFLCDSEKQICNMFDKEDNLLYRDSFHFSIYGAKYFAQDFYDKFLKKDVNLIIGDKNE